MKKRATVAISEQGIQDLSATGKEKTTKTTDSRKYLREETGFLYFSAKAFSQFYKYLFVILTAFALQFYHFFFRLILHLYKRYFFHLVYMYSI